MADNMLIPTKSGTLITVSTKLAKRYYDMYKHHLEHNDKLSESELAYLILYVKYYEKVRDTEHV